MENEIIESMKKLLQLKEETIKELERQIQLLKNQPNINQLLFPLQPIAPAPYVPVNPWITQPINPLQTPYIITSDGNPIPIVGTGTLPNGSVQTISSSPSNISDMLIFPSVQDVG